MSFLVRVCPYRSFRYRYDVQLHIEIMRWMCICLFSWFLASSVSTPIAWIKSLPRLFNYELPCRSRTFCFVSCNVRTLRHLCRRLTLGGCTLEVSKVKADEDRNAKLEAWKIAELLPHLDTHKWLFRAGAVGKRQSWEHRSIYSNSVVIRNCRASLLKMYI